MYKVLITKKGQDDLEILIPKEGHDADSAIVAAKELAAEQGYTGKVVKAIIIAETTELSLAEQLVFPVLDIDTDIEPALIRAGELTAGIVHTNDEAGMKAMRADSVVINKYTKAAREFDRTVYGIETKASKEKSNRRIELIKVIENNLLTMKKQGEENAQARIDETLKKVTAEMNAAWDSMDIKKTFRVADLSPLNRLSGVLTDNGNLTAKAAAWIATKAAECLAEQNKIAARELIIENTCLKAGIIPAFTKEHVGAEFYASDSIFQAKFDQLVTAEIARKVEMDIRAEEKQKKETQRKIDEALAAQQQENIRIAREDEAKRKKAADELRAQETKAKLMEKMQAKADQDMLDAKAKLESKLAEREKTIASPTAQQIENLIAASRQDEAQRKNNANGLKEVTIIATFKRSVPDGFADEFILNNLKSRMTADLLQYLVSIELQP